jgi:hypothetical protein
MDEKPILLDLETLYLGIPDESVNLTFQDLANVNTSENRNQTTTNQPISEVSNNVPTRANLSPSSSLAKIPSLDFSKGLQASNQHNHHHHDIGHGDSPWGQFGHRIEENREHVHVHVHDPPQFSHANGSTKSPRSRTGGDDCSAYSLSYDDVSMASGRGGGSGGRRRPGIPHSKICTICSTYVYIFRTRCLVCQQPISCSLSNFLFVKLVEIIYMFGLR